MMPILSSCVGNLTPLNDDEVEAYRTHLTPSIPYLTDHYVLPTLNPNPHQFNLSWSSDNLTVDKGVLLYVSPQQTMTITVLATLSRQLQVLTFEYPLLLKTQLDVPEYNVRPKLFLRLQGQRLEPQINDVAFTPAVAIKTFDSNGVYTNQTIPSLLGIQTRGHSTKDMPKRPYRIRFDQNTSLFGMKEAKNYILLANYLDRSLIRNSLVTWMSKFYDSSMYTLDYRFVDLYINDRYYGQYLLTERIEFQPNRLAMTHNLQQDDAGFLIELDYQVYLQEQGNENLEWFRMNNVPYVVKEPNPLTTIGYGTRHTQFIKQYFQSTRNALVTKTNVEQWIDVTNWIHYFLIQEIVKNVDVGWGSVYMTKTPGGKLQHMPLWDFDLALGSAQYMFDADPNGYLPQGHWGWNGPEKNNYFTLMMTIPSIRQQFKDALLDFQQRLLPQVLLWLQDNQIRMAVLSVDNFTLWPMSSCTGWCPLPDQLINMTTISQHFQYLQHYLQTRVDWMVNHI